MKFIIQRKLSDGTWPTVGMNNQWPISDLTTVRGCVNRLKQSVWAKKGGHFRILDGKNDGMLREVVLVPLPGTPREEN